FSSNLQKVGDGVIKKVLNLLPFNQLKKTLTNQAEKTSKKPSKKRIIYDIKENLNSNESDDLFRSIMERFYS
ncbi:MAG: hypothetical protein CL836_02750, partial [Crocinitomicaceae bacterium]|nr:hypothetical protein [Crocinitomicaceae bacterium]